MTLIIKKWDRYNKLTIIGEESKYVCPCGKKHRRFLCKCDCWNKKIILLNKLRSWMTKSCGCLVKEFNKTKITHWKSHTRIWEIRAGITQRCNNSIANNYKNYGWRWIKCKWKNFKEFYEDMWESYKKHLKKNNWDTTIERKNVNWNYCKENCRWATIKEQSNNKRNNKIIKYKWNYKTLSEWCDLYWLRYWTILERIKSWYSIKQCFNYKKYERNKNRNNRLFEKTKR